MNELDEYVNNRIVHLKDLLSNYKPGSALHIVISTRIDELIGVKEILNMTYIKGE